MLDFGPTLLDLDLEFSMRKMPMTIPSWFMTVFFILLPFLLLTSICKLKLRRKSVILRDLGFLAFTQMCQILRMRGFYELIFCIFELKKFVLYAKITSFDDNQFVQYLSVIAVEILIQLLLQLNIYLNDKYLKYIFFTCKKKDEHLVIDSFLFEFSIQLLSNIMLIHL